MYTAQEEIDAFWAEFDTDDSSCDGPSYDEQLHKLRHAGPLPIGSKIHMEDNMHNLFIVSGFAKGGTELVFKGEGVLHLKPNTRLVDENGDLAATVKARLPHDKGIGTVYAHNLRPVYMESTAPLSAIDVQVRAIDEVCKRFIILLPTFQLVH